MVCIHRLFSSALLVCLLINLSSSGLTLEKLRNHVLRCYGGFVKVIKLWDLAPGVLLHPFPNLTGGSLPSKHCPRPRPLPVELILSQTLMSRGMP